MKPNLVFTTKYFLVAALLGGGVGNAFSQSGSLPANGKWVALGNSDRASETKFQCLKKIGAWQTHAMTPGKDTVLFYECHSGAFNSNSVWATMQKPAGNPAATDKKTPFTKFPIQIKGFSAPVMVHAAKSGKHCVLSAGMLKGKWQLMIMGRVALHKDLKSTVAKFTEEFLNQYFETTTQYQ